MISGLDDAWARQSRWQTGVFVALAIALILVTRVPWTEEQRLLKDVNEVHGRTLTELRAVMGEYHVSVYTGDGMVIEDTRLADLDLVALQPCTIRVQRDSNRFIQLVVKEGKVR